MPVHREASLNGLNLRIAVIAARFNERITRRLVDGALDMLLCRNVPKGSVSIIWVPGAFEIPLAGALWLARPEIDAAIGLGCVIRGETAHFDHVAGAAADGILRVSLEARKPFVFGVLTTDTLDQALARSAGGLSNAGASAALTAIEMANLARGES